MEKFVLGDLSSHSRTPLLPTNLFWKVSSEKLMNSNCMIRKFSILLKPNLDLKYYEPEQLKQE